MGGFMERDPSALCSHSEDDPLRATLWGALATSPLRKKRIPALSEASWAVIHSLVAVAIVLFGGYQRFETFMKVFIGVMFAGLMGCAIAISPPTTTLSLSIVEASIPRGSVGLILGIIGGVGGLVCQALEGQFPAPLFFAD